MTPTDRLRSFVKEATPGPWVSQSARDYDSERAQIWLVCTKDDEPETWQGVAECDLDRPFENARLIALVPQLAELVADMGEALGYIEWVWDGMENTCPSCGIAERAGHDSSCRTAPVLARLAALFPEDSA